MLVAKSDFEKHLDAEMRKAEQTNASLSMVHFANNQITSPALYAALGAGTWPTDRPRATNVVDIDEAGIRLLLPGLTKAEAQEALAGVSALLPKGQPGPVVYTYPDDVKECILNGLDATQIPFVQHETARHREGAWLKRLLDIGGGLLGLGLLSPMFAVTAVAIALTSPGPVIFKQTRLGRNGRPFTLYKFRTMVTGADSRIHQEYVTGLIVSSNEGVLTTEPAAAWTQLPDDPRVTRIGKWLRRLKLDEFPQLLNVVKGDLSLVGPRPALAYEVSLYRHWHLRRMLGVKPGLTGLWQIEGGDQTTFDEMIRMDLKYIDQWSNRLDLQIIARTVALVFRRLAEPLNRGK